MLQRICDAFGITMVQLFAGDGEKLDLIQEQKEILEMWDMLGFEERRILLQFVHSLKDK